MTDREEQEKYIVEQYRTVAGVINTFWREVSLRTLSSSWRQEGPDKGMGSCAAVYKDLSEDLLDGPAYSRIIRLRDELNFETPGESGRCPCPYYREDKGCILGGLKSPRCLDHIDWGINSELVERFGICFTHVKEPLKRVLLGGINPQVGDYEIKPEVNNGFVKTFCEGAQATIDYIKTFPILHPEEVEK